MVNKRYQTANEPVAARHRSDGVSHSGSDRGGKEEPVFILRRRSEAYSVVSSLLWQVWEELPNKDWFAIDGPAILAHTLRLASTFIFEACTPWGALSSVCVLVAPETEEENLGRYAGIPRSEWHRVMHVDMAATLPAYRGHSLQRRLMDYAENCLRQKKDTKYLMATVHPDNVPSRRSMEKLGYTCVAQATLYGGLPRCVYCKKL